MSFRGFMLTGEQIRAGRALARIEQAELAHLSGLSVETIKRLERIHGQVQANVRTLTAILQAFADLSIFFEVEEDGRLGVRLQPDRTSPQAAVFDTPTDVRRPLYRLIYHSAATTQNPHDRKATLDDILLRTMERNVKLQITGCLLACQHRFLQALEGPKEAVMSVFGGISADPRHDRLKVLDARPVPARLFEDWTFCCGLFSSDDKLLASEPAMRDGFNPELLTPAGALGLLTLMRDLQRSPPRSLRGETLSRCSLTRECLDQACAHDAA